MLSQLEISQTGDLYLAGDDSYTKMAQEKGLAAERLPVAMMRPVIAVKKDDDSISNWLGNPGLCDKTASR